MLTANRKELSRPDIIQIANRHGRTVAQVVFRFAIDLGMIPLTGTTSSEHMQADLDVFSFRLEAREVEQIEQLCG